MEIAQKIPAQIQAPPARRQRFSPKLLEDERFIDPAKEAAVILPKQEMLSTISVELQSPALQVEKRQLAQPSLFAILYEQILSWLNWLRAKFKGSKKERARLTRAGKRALEQLRYLALLCEATEIRTPDEALAADSAFGEAYYEIMRLSANLTSMKEQEREHHHEQYCRYMRRLLRASE
ncbi:MAG: hypothetical protein N3G22_03375 [Candidatus Micrarchaeota archaeon]|nr:hypothetical protein [Candidatus Micrarchaeota archaeon]